MSPLQTRSRTRPRFPRWLLLLLIGVLTAAALAGLATLDAGSTAAPGSLGSGPHGSGESDAAALSDPVVVQTARVPRTTVAAGHARPASRTLPRTASRGAAADPWFRS